MTTATITPVLMIVVKKEEGGAFLNYKTWFDVPSAVTPNSSHGSIPPAPHSQQARA
jgi:hypothetical protein